MDIPQFDPATADQTVIALMKAIGQQETGGVAKAGATGEMKSVYQWEPGTWSAAAKQYLGDANTPISPGAENYVAYQKISDWKKQGKSPGQIASLWNSGNADPYAKGNKGVGTSTGTNVGYNVPHYVSNVLNNYQKFSKQSPTNNNPVTPPPPKTALGFGENVLTSGANLATGLAQAVVHPVKTIETLGNLVLGVGEDIAGAVGLMGDQTQAKSTKQQQLAGAVGQFYKARYGSADAIKNTLYSDPLGVALDAATILDAGAGVVGKVGDFTKAAGVAQGLDALEAGGDAAKARSVFETGQKISKVGKGLKTAGEVVNPFTLPGKVVGAGAKAILNSDVVQTGLKGAKTAVSDLFDKYGVKAPLSTISKSSVAGAAEKFAGTAGKTATEARTALTDIEQTAKSDFAAATEDASKTFQKSSQDIAENLNSDEALSKSDLSQFFKDTASKLVKVFNEKTDALYGKLMENPLAKTMQANVSNSVETLKNLISQRDLAEASSSKFKDWLQAITPEDKQIPTGFVDQNGKPLMRTEPATPITFEKLKAIRSEVGKLQNSADVRASGLTSLYKSLYGALSDDMSKTASSISPEFAQAYTNTQTYFRQGINLINKSVGKVLANGDISKIMKFFTNAKNSNDLVLLKTMVGDDVFEKVGNNLIADLVKKSVNSDGDFTLSKFKTNVSKLDMGTIKNILSPEQNQSLQEALSKSDETQLLFDKLEKDAQGKLDQTKQDTQTMRRSLVGSARGTTTLKVIKVLAEVGLASFHHPLVAIAGILGQNAFADWVESPAGRAMLTGDFSIPASKVTKLISKLHSLGGTAALGVTQAGKIRNAVK